MSVPSPNLVVMALRCRGDLRKKKEDVVSSFFFFLSAFPLLVLVQSRQLNKLEVHERKQEFRLGKERALSLSLQQKWARTDTREFGIL